MVYILLLHFTYINTRRRTYKHDCEMKLENKNLLIIYIWYRKKKNKFHFSQLMVGCVVIHFLFYIIRALFILLHNKIYIYERYKNGAKKKLHSLEMCCKLRCYV